MLKILQITDMHILPDSESTLMGIKTDKYFRLVLQHALEKYSNIDLILLTGDLTQNPCPESYQRILKILQSSNTPCLCLPGNHDDAVLMRQILNQVKVNCKKCVHLKNWQIICLDSQRKDNQGGLLTSKELDFLARQLEQQKDLNTLIAVHHHCLLTNSEWMDTMIIENSNALFEIIGQHPQVKAVIHGHIHQAIEKKHNNIPVFGTPATCFQFEPRSQKFALDNKPPGYRILKMYPDSTIKTEVNWLKELPLEVDFNCHSY